MAIEEAAGREGALDGWAAATGSLIAALAEWAGSLQTECTATKVTRRCVVSPTVLSYVWFSGSK